MENEPPSVLLIQFARAPLEGRVKTRMMPCLSASQACELHCDLVLWTCRQLMGCGLGDIELAVTGEMAHPLFGQCLALGVTRISMQRGEDLGQRMYSAMRHGLERYTRVVLVGSDCPGIDPAYIRQALVALESATVVLGPALDGGYVLIGARRIEQEIFTGIPWGTGQVYAKTIARLRQAGVSWLALPVLADVDRPEDLPAWEDMKSGRN